MTNKEKTKIKVVKRGDAKPVKGKKKRVATSRMAAREVVSTVTGWVADLKQRKSEETKAAFDLLFSSNRQPTES